MSANFAFYIHHHGSGHLMRALSIASQLRDAGITFLGSSLSKYAAIIPETIHCVHLPEDVAGPEDAFASRLDLDFLHYVPLNVEKVAARAAAISTALHSLFPVILVVDVSVEVTILATLCGVPTVVIRQNGDRDDAAHLHAYQCAQLLIAPSSEQLMNVSTHDWVNAKTFFSGGFSKYSRNKNRSDKTDERAIGVIVGSGGTSLNAAVVNTLANQCVDSIIHVIGEIQEADQISEPNIIFHGHVNHPESVLARCNVVIGNAGHNTVMEMADLGKKFVCIPEDRPFREQWHKAALLAQNGMAVIVQPEELKQIDWRKIIGKAENLPENCWQGVINDEALTHVANRLYELWDQNFPQTLS